MTKRARRDDESETRSEARAVKAASSPDGFEKAKKLLVLACAAIAGGLAIAGSIDRSTGGVVLLVGWLLGVASLHRLGRTGSDRSSGA